MFRIHSTVVSSRDSLIDAVCFMPLLATLLLDYPFRWKEDEREPRDWTYGALRVERLTDEERTQADELKKTLLSVNVDFWSSSKEDYDILHLRVPSELTEVLYVVDILRLAAMLQANMKFDDVEA